MLTGIGCDGAGAAKLGAPAVISGRRDHGLRPGPPLNTTSVGKGTVSDYRVFMTDEDYIVIDADSPEEAMLKLRDAGLEPVKAEPFPVQSNGLILEQ